MIDAVHLLLYSADPPATRAFFRDVLNWPHVELEDGWLIFKSGPSELGVHPTMAGAPAAGTWYPSLMCDDIDATISELKSKGVVFTAAVEDQGFGLTAHFQVPGAGEMQVYQPKHPIAYNL